MSNAGKPISPYQEFIKRLELLIHKHPNLITMTLSNIFTMRLIGNKTHGDLAEIAISEFINQYMYDFSSVHVGKNLFRSKSKEQDIEITNDMNEEKTTVSLKAYGIGPLQLSTDKNKGMYDRLEKERTRKISDRRRIKGILRDSVFENFKDINVLSLIYDEKNEKCNILVFDYDTIFRKTHTIQKASAEGSRKYPVFRFLDKKDGYICEVRYGGASDNALQRGLWTNTRNAIRHFTSITSGWIDYSHNRLLVDLFSHALVASESGHAAALSKIKEDIERIYAGVSS